MEYWIFILYNIVILVLIFAIMRVKKKKDIELIDLTTENEKLRSKNAFNESKLLRITEVIKSDYPKLP